MIKLIEGKEHMQGLPQISKHMYQDTYFLADEDYDQWVDRITTAYSNDANHKVLHLHPHKKLLLPPINSTIL